MARRPGTSTRLFFTVALIYLVHFATNVVRETYLAVSLGTHLSIRVDEFEGLHPDLFTIPGRGTYINSNPGASMLGAVPYAAARPAIDLLFRLKPELGTPKAPAKYDDPRPNRTTFLNEARSRGLDVKLGLAALVTHAGLMVPLGALGALVMFWFLRGRLNDERLALILALLYAVGTPVFFRSAFLNQNAIATHAVLGAFVLMAGLTPRTPGSIPLRVLPSAGALLGLALLCDYSSIPLLLAFGCWALVDGWAAAGPAGALRSSARYTLGALGPIAVLLAYQWAAFGNPFLPAQAYMPATPLSVHGWHGLTLPTFQLLAGNLVDPDFGLLIFCPMLAAAVAAPFLRRRPGGITRGELGLIFGTSLGFWVFNSANQFGLLQFNTGVRYMVPAVPLLFIALVPVLLRLPKLWSFALVIPTVVISWSVAMARENVPTSLAHIFLTGPELPWLTVLRKTAGAYAPLLAGGVSPIMVFAVVGVVLWVLWRTEDLLTKPIPTP
jgi:hypothetical protein